MRSKITKRYAVGLAAAAAACALAAGSLSLTTRATADRPAQQATQSAQLALYPTAVEYAVMTLTLGSGPAHAEVCDNTCHFLDVEFGNGGLSFFTE